MKTSVWHSIFICNFDLIDSKLILVYPLVSIELLSNRFNKLQLIWPAVYCFDLIFPNWRWDNTSFYNKLTGANAVDELV